MKNLSLSILVFSSLHLSCAKNDFNGTAKEPAAQGNASSQVESNVASPINTQTVSTVIPETRISSETSDSESYEAETSAAMEPAMVGGAFLVCVQSVQVECRLDTEAMSNINPSEGLKLEFSTNNQAVTFTPSSLQGFRWHLNTTAAVGSIRSVVLKISSASGKEWIYQTEFDTQALQIGDGTRALQGCTQTFVRQSKMVGLSYDMPFQVPVGMSSFMINLTGLCGIIRPNDSMIRLLDATAAETFKEFLPVTAAPVSLKYKVLNLKPGAYILRVTPGDDIDIDDLFINSLAISSLGR